MKFFFLAISLLSFSCSKNQDATPFRTYRMGFQNSAPRFDSFNLFIQSLNIWSTRADAAIISSEVPWKVLLAGETAETYVADNFKGLTAYYRSKNFVLWVYVDPQNGLDRTSDATELAAVGKSIAQADIQKIYRRYVVVLDSILKPEHIGLALETNLIKVASSPQIYNGVKQAANDAAKDLKLNNSLAKLSISVQVEQAWGKLTGSPYTGIAQDLADFPFVEELGLSSYPYLVFNVPADIPPDYYSRLVDGKTIPVFVAEGGWSSHSVTTPSRSFVSSNLVQQDYIKRQEQLLNSVQATALFQLAFTDIDVSSLPSTVPSNIGYFAWLGLVDVNLQPKPSLNAWDVLFKKPFK